MSKLASLKSWLGLVVFSLLLVTTVLLAFTDYWPMERQSSFDHLKPSSELLSKAPVQTDVPQTSSRQLAVYHPPEEQEQQSRF